MVTLTICTIILKNNVAIKEADIAKGVQVVAKQKSQMAEQLMLIRINEKQFSGCFYDNNL